MIFLKINYFLFFYLLIINILKIFNFFYEGIGDWGLGIGDWGLGPIPSPQSPIPNPQSPTFYKNNNKILTT